MTVKVEIGIGKTGATTSLYDVYFDDVSSYVRNISTTRGKSNELDSYDAGQAKVALSNQDRLFDPSYSSSPFSNLVVPTGILKISVDGYVIFTGLIQDWNLTFEQSGDSIAEVDATDAFWLLSNLTLNQHIPADSQTSTQRLQTILTRPEVNWSSLDTQFSTGKAILGGDSSEWTVSQGTSALEYSQLIEKSEVGRLFIGKDGKLNFKTRNDDIFALNYSYTRTNLSTNPSFENDVTNWTVGAGTFTRNTTTSYVGSACGELSASGSITQYFNAKSNSVYTISVYVQAKTSSTDLTLAGYESLTGSTWTLLKSTTQTVTNGSWQRLSFTMTTDTDYTNAKFVITNSASDAVLIDAILIEANPVIDVYFDGSNPPANGTVNGITYTYSAVWN